MYIAIAGNIGSGKTTLTNMLAKHYGWKKFLEPVEKNPYLDDYYKDIPRWVLNMEVYYLKQRFKNLLDIQHGVLDALPLESRLVEETEDAVSVEQLNGLRSGESVLHAVLLDAVDLEQSRI